MKGTIQRRIRSQSGSGAGSYGRMVAVLLWTMLVCVGVTACGKETLPSEEAAGVEEEQGARPSSYAFVNDGTKVTIGTRADTVTDRVGELLQVNEAATCAFGDLDKIWTYNDFTLYSWQEHGFDYIYDIVLTSDAVATAEGVYIGDSADRVRAAYGTPDEADEAHLVYNGEDMKLLFILTDDGMVRSIEYSSDKLR